MDRREAVARAIARRFWLTSGTPDDPDSLPKRARHRREPDQSPADAYTEAFWADWLPEADDAIAAYEAWQGKQRLKAHEHMVSNPAWAVEMFGRGRGGDREDDVDEAQR